MKSPLSEGPQFHPVRAMPMPHVMFYAPNITNEDIGAVKESIAEQSYMIQVIGEAEKARIMADERYL